MKSIRVFDEQEWGHVRECLEIVGKARDFEPSIYALWNVRGELPAVYWTLTGVSELLRLPKRIHPV